MIIRTISPVKLFYVYAPEDQRFRDRLDVHLSILRRTAMITSWYDRQIVAGTDWEREVSRHLEEASIILLLISSDFLASDYAYKVEMQRALELHKEGKAIVIPILLRPVDWERSPFGSLAALP